MEFESNNNKDNNNEENKINQLKEKFLSYGQEHIFNNISNLRIDSKLYKQLSSLDLESSLSHFHSAIEASKHTSTDTTLEPINDVFDLEKADRDIINQYESIGFNSIIQGKVAAIIMSGGQGTRLGYHGPKGMYKIGLLSDKSIFQIHLERLQKVRLLAQSKNNANSNNEKKEIFLPVFIMTSDVNNDIIQDYFKENNYFNYPSNQIFFFEQGLEPCFTLDGKLILESSDLLSVAPDGNGGLYNALRKSGSVDLMLSHGIEHLHIYGIDNILTKSVDPIFLGYCISSGYQIGNKVVQRLNANEKVGVSALRSFTHPVTLQTSLRRLCIVEYSELPPECTGEDKDGKLIYSHANICNHYISLPFLINEVYPVLSSTYHIAKKKIPYYDPESNTTITPQSINGIKLEMFIFDIFSLGNTFGIMSVNRDDEFAPVKNSNDASTDTPNTARQLLSNQSIRWLKNHGVKIEKDENDERNNECEISPLLSYAGEGLEHLRGATLTLPCYLQEFQIIDEVNI